MGNEARRVLFHHPVISGPVVYPSLDAIGVVFYTAFFIAVTLATLRRPVYGAAILIAVAPFALYQQVLGETLTLSKVALLAVLLGLSSHPNVFATLNTQAPLRVLTAGLLVLCATLLSFAHALHHGPVLREALKMAEYLAIFCATVAAYRADPDAIFIGNVFSVTAIAVSVLALLQELAGAPSGMWIHGNIVPRIAGPLEGPNQLAGYLDIALPVVLALAVQRRTAFALAGVFFCTWTDVLTFSRAGLLAAAVACVIVLIAVRRDAIRSLAVFAAGILCAAAVDVAWAMAAHVSAAGAFRLNALGTNYAGGVGTRSELWHAAIQLWKQHPIFGVGAGNFELEIPLTGLRGVRTHANSLYLQSLVEGGIPLFAATLWLVFVSIATFVRERLESPFVLAALAAGVALALHQVVDFLTFYPKVGAEWWIVMALAAAEMTAPARVREACA